MDTVKGPIEEQRQPHLGNESCSAPPDSDHVVFLLQALAAEFELVMGRPERVEILCGQLARELESHSGVSRNVHLLRLLPLLRRQSGTRASPVFTLLEQAAVTQEDPWPLFEGMLVARDRRLALRALDLAASRAASGTLPVSRREALLLAEQVEIEESPFADPSALKKIAIILNCLPALSPDAPGPILSFFLQEADGRLRRLAARILDLDGRLPSPALREQLLGRDAHEFLCPYLDYTRASHIELLYIAPVCGTPPAVLHALRLAQGICGGAILREVIAELGWARVNLGLEVRPTVGIDVGGTFPLTVPPFVALVLEGCEQVRRVFDLSLFIAHGGLPAEGPGDGRGEDLVARFRAYNLVHAEVLTDILDLAPLTREKVRRILSCMDRIVGDFTALFTSYTDEAAMLPGLYQNLKEQILHELEQESPFPQLSTELTRLVQMFEDPPSLGSVRTLHGLKRYLHQKGLRLGIRLVQAGRSTNRTVDLAVASRRRILRTVKAIRYVDFEPEDESGETSTTIPYPVYALAEAFGRQLLHGQETFPGIKVFCYGNEVHYYLSFRNHPALLRIDFSPPLRGGMIDLEYYGVSKYELSVHPNPSLDAMRLFFGRLEFDVQIDSTHVHARYDKERALDLEDLCEKAGALFSLVTYLMEVDWVIGGLNLGIEARRKVADSWAERFALWHVLPLGQLLTKDRQAILVGLEEGPTGEHELSWSGDGSYRDQFVTALPAEFAAQLRAIFDDLGLESATLREEMGCQTLGQVRFDRCFLDPICEAVGSGELLVLPEGLRRCPPLLFQREHEAERFAMLLDSPDEVLVSAGNLARLVTPLERFLRFQTTGSLNGYEVQRARLPLRGECLGLYVLRDQARIIRLALFTRGEGLWLRRAHPSSPWESNCSCDVVLLARLLRRVNWPAEGSVSSLELTEKDIRQIRQLFAKEVEMRQSAPQPGERIVTGLKASPGRAVGAAVFGTAGRSPKDLDGAVLIAPAVRPEDNTFLYHSAGIVSTGGGVLSHAGLIAIQFHKPALIIAGHWHKPGDGPPVLLYRSLDFREEQLKVRNWCITVRRRMREQEYELREGDLVVLDADEGTLRVLGQDRVTLALHESFQLFSVTSRRLVRASDPKEILSLRGWRLRARHQIEKVLGKLADPVLAQHAVHEILLGKIVDDVDSAHGERARLLSLILDNRLLGEIAQDYLLHTAAGMERRYRLMRDKAMERVSTSASVYEILTLRLEVLRFRQSLREISAALRGCGFDGIRSAALEAGEIDLAVRSRLRALRSEKAHAADHSAASPSGTFRSRQLLRQVERIDAVLGSCEGAGIRFQVSGFTTDASAEKGPAGNTEPESLMSGPDRRFVLGPEECRLGLFPLTGWKAANLAEVERVGGPGLVPSWFVVSDRAFEELLSEPLDRIALGREGVPPGVANLREAIGEIVARRDLDNAQKSILIRGFWENANLSRELTDEVLAAYRRLAGEALETSAAEADLSQPFVAIRSSAREEDAELAARAGEFETFLFIRGEKALLDHLKRAWSGLWTERALHNRAILGTGPERTGGGIIVQRIVWSRVSGVLQTINVAEGEMREMVINAGLGLGEGIVSGVAAADQIVVDKESNLETEPLRFRYVTADKRERVVFNKRLGMGTAREETLYHQRLRPALEYVELTELVRAAASLEEAYGFPLDIEFGIEGTRLWILQVRPVATFMAVLRETIEHYPLN